MSTNLKDIGEHWFELEKHRFSQCTDCGSLYPHVTGMSQHGRPATVQKTPGPMCNGQEIHRCPCRKLHQYGDKTPGAWQAFLDAMHSGEQFECDAAMYDYWLGVLPPKFYRRDVSWPDGMNKRVDFGFAEGAELITAFWAEGGRFFGRRTTVMATF